MNQSTPQAIRRTAALGATVALVAVSSMIGVGATAAVADPAEPTAISTTSTSAPTDAPDDTGASSAPSGPSTNPSGTETPAASGAADPAPSEVPAEQPPTGPTEDAAAPTPQSTGGPTPQSTGAPESAATTAPSAAAANPDAAVTWPEPSSPSDPIVFTTTAGEPFRHQFVAQGGDGPLEYGFAPAIGFDALAFFSWGDDGVLEGTPTVADSYDFSVLATDTRHPATQWIRVEVVPAAAADITAEVTSGPDGQTPAWEVSDAGVAPVGGGGLVDAVPVEPGGSLWMDAVVTDRYGNPVNGREMPSPSDVTSSVPSDTLVRDDTRELWKVTFPDAGPRTLTMTSAGLTVTIPVSAQDAPLAFSGTGTSDELRTTAGEAFSRTWSTTGATGSVQYAVQFPDGEVIDPAHADARFPDHLTLDRASGVLSGTPTVAGDYRFQVVATDGTQVARRAVHLVVTPGATTQLLTFISRDDQLVGSTTWGFGPGGQLIRIDGTGEAATHTDVDSVPVRQGESLFVKTTPVDRWGNATAPTEPAPDDPRPEVTSSVSSDEVTFLPAVWTTQIRFPHASVHTITVALAGATSTFDVSVTPETADGSLAYTGADTSAPVAWAVGLLAAGAGLLVHRLRRRRD